MNDELRNRFEEIDKKLRELDEVQGAHRAFISQHQSALKSIAQIMEIDRGLDTPL